MAKYKEYQTVILKDGREATIVEIVGDESYIADIGDSPEDWDDIVIHDNEIKSAVKM